MASPQLENGHIRIANDLFEHICSARLTGTEYAVLLALIRKTYGWGKKEDAVSCSQLQALTDIPHRITVHQTLVRLEAAKLIAGEHRPGKPTTYRINKDYDLWLPVAQRLHVAPRLHVAQRLQDMKPTDYTTVSPQATGTVSLQATHNSTHERHSEKDTSLKQAESNGASASGFIAHPLGKAYREQFWPLGVPQNELRPGWRAIKILETHPVYTDKRAIKGLSIWKEQNFDPEDRKPFAWIAAALWDILTNSKHADGLGLIPEWAEAKSAWLAKAEVTA